MVLNVFLFLSGVVVGFLAVRWFSRREKASENFNQKSDSEVSISPRELLLTTTAKMREGILIVGEDQRILSINEAAKQIFSLDSNDSKDFSRHRLTDLTRDLSVHQAFRAALENGAGREVRVEARAKNEKRIYDLHITPLALDAEKRRSAIGVFYEITKLEKLEIVRQEFLSNVSHELRTPLTSILAFVETLEDGAIDDAENNGRFLGIIRKNAERMHRLINDILELSAIESGKIEIKPQEIWLAELVETVKTNLLAKAESRQISIENRVASEIKVFADAVRLEQMLTNLVDNAVKFNREGGTVTIDCEKSAARDLIRVADTGEGFASEHAERIFERFYRVDRARSRDLGGTGLGLSIVKHLARMHGGEATVQSKLGEGTIFTIELPSSAEKE